MTKAVLWIDDSSEHRTLGREMLLQIGGITPYTAASSSEAREILETTTVHAVVTDILRRRPDRSISDDDGARFFREYIRSHPLFQDLPVLFHTKNLPDTFTTDGISQYPSKWDSPAKKAIELETRLNDSLGLYKAYTDFATRGKSRARDSSIISESRGRYLSRSGGQICRLMTCPQLGSSLPITSFEFS
jgi:CheY-like chemotaxis protein